jgi:hypothetical protein
MYEGDGEKEKTSEESLINKRKRRWYCKSVAVAQMLP